MPTDADTIAWHRKMADLLAEGSRKPAAASDPVMLAMGEAMAEGMRQRAAHHARAADALEDLAATRRALDEALASAGEAHAENERLMVRVAELEAEIERRDSDDFNAMVEGSLAD